eukprot:GHVT01004872.1.p1 GENE.GHVT01004872.1~~GHVT01004872.1.p1  ORF type:complete len:640 (-),score=109.58 GHVT01004872.1:1034-2953(-)
MMARHTMCEKCVSTLECRATTGILCPCCRRQVHVVADNLALLPSASQEESTQKFKASGRSKDAEEALCPMHSESLLAFCKSCECFICHRCFTTDGDMHYSHHRLDKHAGLLYMKEEARILRTDMKSICWQIRPMIEATMSAKVTLQKQHESAHEQARRSIDAIVSMVETMMQFRTAAFDSKLKESFKEQSRRLDSGIRDVNAIVQQTTDVITNIESIIGCTTSSATSSTSLFAPAPAALGTTVGVVSAGSQGAATAFGGVQQVQESTGSAWGSTVMLGGAGSSGAFSSAVASSSTSSFSLPSLFSTPSSFSSSLQTASGGPSSQSGNFSTIGSFASWNAFAASSTCFPNSNGLSSGSFFTSFHMPFGAASSVFGTQPSAHFPATPETVTSPAIADTSAQSYAGVLPIADAVRLSQVLTLSSEDEEEEEATSSTEVTPSMGSITPADRSTRRRTDSRADAHSDVITKEQQKMSIELRKIIENARRTRKDVKLLLEEVVKKINGIESSSNAHVPQGILLAQPKFVQYGMVSVPEFDVTFEEVRKPLFVDTFASAPATISLPALPTPHTFSSFAPPTPPPPWPTAFTSAVSACSTAQNGFLRIIPTNPFAPPARHPLRRLPRGVDSAQRRRAKAGMSHTSHA